MVAAGDFSSALPIVGSHEGAGTIVRLGSGVRNFNLGDRVMAGILLNRCGICPECQGAENYTQYCRKPGGMCGVTQDGFFAEYAVIDSRQAVRIPDQISSTTAAPMACAGCTVYRGVALSGVQKGEWLGIVGSGGGLGHIGVQFAKALGMNVVGVDARDGALELTTKYGADVTLDARKGQEEVVKQVHAVTGGEGVKCTLNVSDNDSAMALSCAITRLHGDVVQIAQPENVVIPFRELVFRDIRVRGSLISSTNESRDMLDLVAKHGIEVQTNVFKGLGEIKKVVELAESGEMKGKAVIVVNEDQ